MSGVIQIIGKDVEIPPNGVTSMDVAPGTMGKALLHSGAFVRVDWYTAADVAKAAPETIEISDDDLTGMSLLFNDSDVVRIQPMRTGRQIIGRPHVCPHCKLPVEVYLGKPD